MAWPMVFCAIVGGIVMGTALLVMLLILVCIIIAATAGWNIRSKSNAGASHPDDIT